MKHVLPETKKANSSILQTLTGAKNIKARRRMEIGIPAVWNRGHYKTASAVGFATPYRGSDGLRARNSGSETSRKMYFHEKWESESNAGGTTQVSRKSLHE
jgi:hypothetical protein